MRTTAGLTFCLRKLAMMSIDVELALGDADRLKLSSRRAGHAKERKGQLSTSWLSFRPDLRSASSNCLRSGGITRSRKLHGRVGVLHGAIVDHNQLLHIVRNGGARIA